MDLAAGNMSGAALDFLRKQRRSDIPISPFSHETRMVLRAKNCVARLSPSLSFRLEWFNWTHCLTSGSVSEADDNP